MNHFDKDALRYHAEGRPGKIEVVASKACHTDQALSLAYTPGVAAPCKEIAKDPDKVYDYTAKGNLVAVITNGTAVLGLGNIGPLAGKPVMEGKAVLFKQFADIDVFDLELNASSTAEFIASIRTLEPTFGGINLEDIRSPECFEIEETLQKELSIPVFHDDQHGTAIVVSAALINACSLTKRDLKEIKVVFCGAGAAAIACANMFVRTGVSRSNITMCDLHGIVFKGRSQEMDKYKDMFAQETHLRTITDALKNADVLVGLSAGNVVSGDMIKAMDADPIIFALANPTPEIDPQIARAIHPNAIIATGRSDFPNQVNNLLGFPYIFRGALDVRATKINEAMMLAATNAIAALAREDVPDSVSHAYGDRFFRFGPDYILPKPFDPRVLLAVAPAVAKAAMDSGVAKKPIEDFEAYRDRLESIQGPTKCFIRTVVHRVKANSRDQNHRTPKIIFPEGANPKILKALNLAVDEHLVHPILIGNSDSIFARISELGLTGLKNIEIIDPAESNNVAEFTQFLFDTRKRKGITHSEAKRLVANNFYFAALAVALGKADGLVAGASSNYSECLRPILQIIGVGRSGLAAGLNIVLFKRKIILFADTSINKCPSSEDLAKIAIHASKAASYFGLTPKIAMLSYSNFTGEDGVPQKMRNATELVKKIRPDLIVDGEMQADTAIDSEIVNRIFPFCEIKGGANVLIFPNLESGNISYKLLQQLGGGEVIGPFIMGLRHPANVVARASSTEDIYNTIAMTALQIQAFQKSKNILIDAAKN
jgi:malate dehydrogenase (oxaloacetate-decarboxylating)(NADP+)